MTYMLKKIDTWICECLLYLDFKQKNKGMDNNFRLLLLLVLSSTMFLNFISVCFIFSLFGFQEQELVPLVPICLSFILFLLLYKRYHYNDNYVFLSKKQGHKKKLWGTVIFYIIFTFILMWILIICAVSTEKSG